MKQNLFRTRRSREHPIAWRGAEQAALLVNASDTCDDRVSENIFEIEDERLEVDSIVRGMNRSAH